MMRERIQLVNEMRDMVGKYFSVEYMRKNVLKQSESEIAEMDKQIKQEIDDGIYHHHSHKQMKNPMRN